MCGGNGRTADRPSESAVGSRQRKVCFIVKLSILNLRKCSI